jgi:hypothetical protein
MAPRLTHWLISARCLFMASTLTVGMTNGAGAAFRTDGAKQISPGKPPIAPDARTRAALGPNAGQRALLADAGFILKPDFDRPAGKLLRDCGARQQGEVFLASRSLCGCRGRTDMLLKFSFFKSLPTLRSCRRTWNLAAMRSRRSAQRQRTTPSVLRSGPLSTHAATLYLSIANRREAGEVTDASQPDTPQGHGARV